MSRLPTIRFLFLAGSLVVAGGPLACSGGHVMEDAGGLDSSGGPDGPAMEDAGGSDSSEQGDGAPDALGDAAPATVLTVTVSGPGRVTSSPAGIDCGADCAETYAHGTIVTLTATPEGCSRLSGWSGACGGTGSCSVTMDESRLVVAAFEVAPCDADGDGYAVDVDCDDDDRDVHPGAVDPPDTGYPGVFLDSNCDGIDGDASSGVFVSVSTGSDAGNVWGDRDHPFRTIQSAIAFAVSNGRTEIYVAEGTYGESLSLASGVDLFGGYDAATWQRADVRQTRVEGPGITMPLRAEGLGSPTRVDRFWIASAPGEAGAAGLTNW